MIVWYKSTIWSKITIDKSNKKKVLKALKSGVDVKDLYHLVKDLESAEVNYGTEEELTPEENGDFTIEVYDGGKVIWNNMPNYNISHKCITCDNKITRFEGKESDKLWEGMWKGGLVERGCAGYGSENDTKGFIIAICDKCIKDKLVEIDYRAERLNKTLGE